MKTMNVIGAPARRLLLLLALVTGTRCNWAPLFPRNYTEFAEAAGVKLLHLHRGKLGEAFQSVHKPLAELGIRSAAIDCSNGREKWQKLIGACTGGTLRLLGGGLSKISDFPGAPTAANIQVWATTAANLKAWAVSALKCDCVTELSDESDLELAVVEASTVALFSTAARAPKLFCHLAMVYSSPALRFGVVLAHSDERLRLRAEAPAVWTWARGELATPALTYTGGLNFEALADHVRERAVEAKQALDRVQERLAAQLMAVAAAIPGLTVVAMVRLGWVTARNSFLGVGAASYLIPSATPFAYAAMAAMMALGFGVALVIQRAMIQREARLAEPAVEEVMRALETLRHETAQPVRLPIRPHDARLPSQDRGVSLHFLRAARLFYRKHGGLELTMDKVCKGGCVNVCTLTRSTGLSLAKSVAIVAERYGLVFARRQVGRAAGFFSYSWTGTQLVEMLGAIDDVVEPLEDSAPLPGGGARHTWIDMLCASQNLLAGVPIATHRSPRSRTLRGTARGRRTPIASLTTRSTPSQRCTFTAPRSSAGGWHRSTHS